ncbi:hypothetical protein LHYA1_G006997 [Lachnellula hyalina]|uniref:Chlorophyllase n=1 Tax=Lachnellula hyalina TaxID=1316788 RepID=A0A8H8TYD0_9HELO|nr:uncharacterized protein LHYA1_G006997 [Lachnellula hyalina]TVY25255.1 hypothetical protein LHYA1_G006997 [Lachnellula hyalina]
MEDHALIGAAKSIPTSPASPILSIHPLTIAAPSRPGSIPITLKVSAPTTGTTLPIILLSHGHGTSNNLSSLHGYSPLAEFWAAHGFVVIQPTHLSSKTLSLDPTTYPEAPLFWRSRVEDMSHIIDSLDAIETSFPAIKGRLDRSKIAVAGHSLGSHTASMLLGARLTDPVDDESAGILLTPIGNGAAGKDLSVFANEHMPVFRNPSFAEMATPTLVVVGDADVSPHLTTRGADWHEDPYRLSEGPKCMLTVFGAGHLLGGVSGYDSAETLQHDTESPERVALVQRLTCAYLHSELDASDGAWSDACAALSLDGAKGLGKVESK